MSWAILGGLLGAGVGAAGQIVGGQQAAGAVPNAHDQIVSGFDPRADPLMALLSAQASAGLGFAPDPNIIGAASPLNRLENSLLGSLGRQTSGRQEKFANQAIQSMQGVVSQGIAQGLSADEISQQVETAFMGFRGQDQQKLFGSAQQIIASGVSAGLTPAEIAAQLKPVYNDWVNSQQSTSSLDAAGKTVGIIWGMPTWAKDAGGGWNANKFEAGAADLIQKGLDSGQTADQIAQSFADASGSREKQGKGPGLIRTALSSAGFDSMSDLITQEIAFRQRADEQNKQLGSLAESRFGARGAANRSIDQILNNYPVYDASNIDQMSQLALQPYQAQELEQANTLGYNPATNLALTRSSGIRDALQILSGRQGLANTALLALRNELGQQTGEALSVSGQTGAAAANAANLASQQALALNQLGQQGAMFQGASLGGSTAGAGAILGDYLSNLGQPGQQRTTT